MASTERSGWSRLVDPHFIAGSALLAVTAVVAGPVARHFVSSITKEPVALRAPLTELDKSALLPFEFVSAGLLSDDELDALGTKQYVSWALKNRAIVDPNHPLALAHLFVTYYSGQPDMVPHTPERCLQGAGYDVKSDANLVIQIVGLPRPVPLRMLSFVTSSVYQHQGPVVCFTFHANGAFATKREEVRLRISDITARRAYYSKIEVSFSSMTSPPRYPTPEQAREATGRLLDKVLPLLLQNHLPDWEAVRREDTWPNNSTKT